MITPEEPRSIIVGPRVAFEWMGHDIGGLKATTTNKNRATPLVYQWGDLYEQMHAEEDKPAAEHKVRRASIPDDLMQDSLDLLRTHIDQGLPHGVDFIEPWEVGTLLMRWYGATATSEQDQKKSETPSS